MVSTYHFQFDIKVVIKIIEIHGTFERYNIFSDLMNFDFKLSVFSHPSFPTFPKRSSNVNKPSHRIHQQDCHLSLGIAILLTSHPQNSSGTKVDLADFLQTILSKPSTKPALKGDSWCNNPNHVIA